MDNRQIKDGLGNIFTIRMRDISPTLDGTIQRSMIFATPYPLDYGTGGIYQYVVKSGVMNAGIAAQAPIIAFRWPGPSNYVSLRRVRMLAWTNSVWAGGMATFDLFAVRNFTSQYTLGTQAALANSNYLRDGMNSSASDLVYSSTDALVPGPGVLDAAPLDSRTVVVPQTTNSLFSNMTMTLFEKLQGEHPLLISANEGFVVQVTLPNDGNWMYSSTIEWDEISAY